MQCTTPVLVKKVFLVFRFDFMFCNLCPLPLVLPEDRRVEESLAPCSSFPPVRCTLVRSHPSLLRAEQPHLSEPLRLEKIPKSHHCVCIMALCWVHRSESQSCTGVSSPDRARRGASAALSRRARSLLEGSDLSERCLIQLRVLLDTFSVRVQGWLTADPGLSS